MAKFICPAGDASECFRGIDCEDCIAARMQSNAEAVVVDGREFKILNSQSGITGRYSSLGWTPEEGHRTVDELLVEDAAGNLFFMDKVYPEVGGAYYILRDRCVDEDQFFAARSGYPAPEWRKK